MRLSTRKRVGQLAEADHILKLHNTLNYNAMHDIEFSLNVNPIINCLFFPPCQLEYTVTCYTALYDEVSPFMMTV